MIAVHLELMISVCKLSLLKYRVAPSTWSSRTVGKDSITCSAKLEHLMTSMEETSESTIMDVLGELSTLMALALPLMRMVVPLQREMRIEWLRSTVISTGLLGES